MDRFFEAKARLLATASACPVGRSPLQHHALLEAYDGLSRETAKEAVTAVSEARVVRGPRARLSALAERMGVGEGLSS